jgi:hypothetical protein
MARPQCDTPLVTIDLDRWVENVFVVFVWRMEIHLYYLYYPQFHIQIYPWEKNTKKF